MKKKIIALIGILSISMTIIGCGKSASRNENNETTGDSIVIDENTKETVENDNAFKISLIGKTEVIARTDNSGGNCFMNENGEIVRYNEMYNNGRFMVDKLQIGSINTKDEDNQGFSSVDWKDNILGYDYFRDEMVVASGKIVLFNGGKIYNLDNGGELKELQPKELIKSINDGLNIQSIRTSEDKSALIYSLGNNEISKMCIVDKKNDKYYEIEGERLESISRGKIEVLTIDGNKIYMALYNSSDYSVTVGYYENNNFYDLVTFSEKNDIKIQITGKILYSNNRLLFLGAVEDKSGIYNYDLDSKNLSSELITESANENYYYINMNADKDKIIIQGTDKNDVFKQSINIASIDKNLEISNIKNIATTYKQGDNKVFEGWAKNGEEFYIRNEHFNVGTDYSIEYETSFEIYKINN